MVTHVSPSQGQLALGSGLTADTARWYCGHFMDPEGCLGCCFRAGEVAPRCCIFEGPNHVVGRRLTCSSHSVVCCAPCPAQQSHTCPGSLEVHPQPAF